MTVRGGVLRFSCSTGSPGAAALGIMAEAAFFFAGGGRPEAGCAGSLDPTSSPGGEWGGVPAGKNRSMTLVTTGNGGVLALLPC